MLNNTLVVCGANCPPACSLCVEACSKRKQAGQEAVIEKIDLPEVNFHSVLTCNECSQPECLEVCPTGAISRSDSGTVVINEAICVGCGICNLVCPYGGIYPKKQEHKSQKCDLCGDKPLCSEACPHNILEYKKAEPILANMLEDPFAPGLPFCEGCGMEWVDRFIMRTIGNDVVLFGAPSCNVTSSRIKASYYGTLMTNVASSATGVSRYFRRIGKDTICLAIIGDGATADLGFGQLSATAERNERILYICYDNEAYMNTGIQRSSTTPFGSWTTTTQVGSVGRGRQGMPKNVPLLMAYHNIEYVATATLAYPEDFMKKLLKAKEAVKKGMAYIHVLTPCPTGWKYKSERGVEITRAAVETNFFPLWEAENGVITLTHEVNNPLPIQEFTKLMRRFAHLVDADYVTFQEQVNHSYEIIKHMASSK
ncbi:thiamine pyrophosphate-dependent enzyme [Sporomusa acidovorans]|uniref:NADH-dependent phenylglyoxylate dehydrogenase subunit beta n=1 Tax=Sporomusa acidovorans (strain ATCC 49682 / DSM 3132 / Mol) TaxID=1123286 RepID=A0ABZ3J8N5_SPOA4|nr:thiamine pyrophosphate-dependent enzyme [Sporomusa acidovorans]OZC16700.1 NADH-dependent phenylglyoxylate dehydrogenase subunit beta [Sporomusa acidovorans DSM 3132]SDE05592.1 phenylglyoxylate dehydrogenase beta subunit [Sporomusa acidovorans]